MHFTTSLCMILLLVIPRIYVIVSAPNEDRITNLPGFTKPIPYKQYSGYLKTTGDKKLHYWFVESQKSPTSDTLVLWLNGGPGCSSLDGFLSELGPLHVQNDGRTLYENKYTWNLISNVLFLESPAGVGFSYSDSKNYTFDDDIVAEDNYAAIKSFFTKFPEFHSNPLYITGESYGGIYVPTLSLLLSRESDINLKGFAVGNGISSFNLNIQSMPYFAYYHGLIGKRSWDALLRNCCKGSQDVGCNFFNNTSTTCQAAVGEVQHVVADIGLNIYGLYQDCWGARDQYRMLLSHILPTTQYNRNSYELEKRRPEHSVVDVDHDPPCINVTAVTTWLNTDTVRRALHIPDTVQPWQVCSDVVGSRYQNIYRDMSAHYHKLLSPGSKLQSLVYNGDTDMACNFLMDEWFVESLAREVSEEWRPWHVNGQIGGFTKAFNHLRYVTIKGAGHMVPQWKPAAAFRMISSFLYDKPL